MIHKHTRRIIISAVPLTFDWSTSINQDRVFLMMNFLAHAYLSFGNKEVLVGNMISDFVKGKAQYDFIENIRKGIVLHRLIDDYTDTHQVIKKAKEYFRPSYRLYSGPIIDILMDHFLASDPVQFKAGELKTFTQSVYQTLNQYSSHLPLRFVPAFTYMQSEDWLFNYQYKEGIAKSIRGLVRRSSFLEDSATAIKIFHEHYVALTDCYNQYFEDVKIYAKEQLLLLND
jgi:acyl carrier protein phosphodiesterase